MCGYPEEGYRLFEYELPLYFPVERAEYFAEGYGGDEGFGLAPAVEDVGVCDFVQGHEYGAEGGVHHEADKECPQDVARGEPFLCGVYEVAEPEAGHESGYS